MSDQSTSPPPGPATLAEQATLSGRPVPDENPPARRRGINFTGVSRAVLIRPFGFISMVGIAVGSLLPPTGLGPSTCGMQRQMGLPCPGCGLTRSVSSFFQGHFAWSWSYHPMGWMFAVIMVVLAVFAVLPNSRREAVMSRLDRHDNKVGWVLIAFMAALIGYGLVRIGFIGWGVPGFEWWRGDGSQIPPFVAAD